MQSPSVLTQQGNDGVFFEKSRVMTESWYDSVRLHVEAAKKSKGEIMFCTQEQKERKCEGEF